MSYNSYTPCDPPCPSSSGTTTTSSTTTTTTCKDATACVELIKDICVTHPGDTCYAIPKKHNLQDILLHFISMLPVPYNCTTTTTTTKAPITTTTTIIPTTTTTTCICPSTTTSTSTSTTTTTTFRPCDCKTYRLKNVTNVTKTYSYTNCSRIRFNNVSLAAGATVLICVCDEDLTYNNNFILAYSLGSGCNTSTTTSTSSTSTTSTSSTTTTTTAAPICQQYHIQSTALPASWSAQTCYGVSVGDTFTTIGQSLYTGCILSNTLVLTNAFIKEIFPCPPTTTTTTSGSTTTSSTSTSTTSTTSSTSTTTTTTVVPTTTTTTLNCECYTLYNSSTTFTASITYVQCGGAVQSSTIAPLQTLNLCVQYGSIPIVPLGMSLTRCGTSCVSDAGCSPCTTTSTTHGPTTTTTTTVLTCDDCYQYNVYSEDGGTFQYINCGGSIITMQAPMNVPVNVPCAVEGSILFIFGFGTSTQGSLCGNTCPTTTTTTIAVTTTTTPIECVGYELNSGFGPASVEWFNCIGSYMTQTFTGNLTICTDGSGYVITSGTVTGTNLGPCA